MKDLKRMLVYGGGAALVIALLSRLAAAHVLSGNAMALLAVLLVIVLPVILGILLGRREHAQNGGHADRE